MKGLAASLFLSLSAAVSAESPPAGPALELVRSMRLDELAARIANHEAEAAALRSRTRKTDCVAPLAPARLSADLSRRLAELLSPEEIATANAFYATSVGGKVVEHTFRQVEHHLAGTGDSPPPPATTHDEDVVFDAFAKTTAGRKFVDSAFLINTPPIASAIDEGVGQAISRCRGVVRTTPGEIVPKSVESPLEREPQAD